MTDRRSPSEEGRAAFARLVGAYGADRRRWPALELARYDAFADDPACAELLEGAAALDARLAEAETPRADERLQRRLLDGFAAASARRRFGLGAPKWLRLAPAGALAALSAAGFVAGSATAEIDDEAIYYAEAAIAEPLDATAGYWPEEQ